MKICDICKFEYRGFAGIATDLISPVKEEEKVYELTIGPNLLRVGVPYLVLDLCGSCAAKLQSRIGEVVEECVRDGQVLFK
jgi:hypothetical protein